MPPRRRPEVTPLEQVRLDRGESQRVAVEGIRRLARERGHPLESLNPAQLCRWEDGSRPSWDNADTLCAYYRTNVIVMGWATDHSPPGGPTPPAGMNQEVGANAADGTRPPAGKPGSTYAGPGRPTLGPSGLLDPGVGPGPVAQASHGSHIDLPGRSSRGRAGAQIMDGVDDTLGFIAKTERATVDPEVMHLIGEQLRSLAGSFHAPTARFTGPLLNIQRAAFRLLDGPTTPEQARELFFLASIACGLLTSVGIDSAQPATAHIYARAALLCADRAGHPGLRAWSRVRQGRVAYWNRAPREALQYFAAAEQDAVGVTGTLPAHLAVQQARAHASLGDAASAHAALARAADARERARPDDLDEIGGGSLTLPLAAQLLLQADALSYLPDHTDTEKAAEEAVGALDTPDHGGSDYFDLALARVDLTLARLERGDIDGGREALQPVLELPAPCICHGIRMQIQRVLVPLADHGYRGSPAAHDLAAQIEQIAQTPQTTRLPE